MKNTIQSNFLVIYTIVLTILLSTTAFAAPPTNDNFANAETVSGMQVHITRSNVMATKESGEPNHAQNIGGKSVWFKWTAPMSRVMSFSTNRSATNIDTLLTVYTGTTLNGLSGSSSSDDINSPLNKKSYIRMDVVEGTTYYFAVDGKNSGNGAAEGSFLLDIQPSFNIQGADYDSDGLTDFAVFRPSAGTWFLFDPLTGQTIYTPFGTNGDIPLVSASGPLNEPAVFRPSNGFWYQQSDGQIEYTQFGTSTDIPVPSNYGGESRTEVAVFRPSTGTWYIRYSEGDYRYYQFGVSGDLPVPGHYSPDVNADIAVFRPSNGTWYFTIRQNGNPGLDTFRAVQFGQQGDKPVPADYDGDGILDIAVYRPSTGTWWILKSSNNQVTAFQWGIAEDVPTTGDFDGDGKFDYAVFRPSNGTWYVYRSGDNSVFSKKFGQSGDIPMTANRTY
jgi:hypothetical protein